MPPPKCASCTNASPADVKAYCVETNQVLCRRCVGLQTYPYLKGNEWTFERLTSYSDLQELSVNIANFSLITFMVVVLWQADLGSDYFKGDSTCPMFGTARRTLARFDANAFYYYKKSLADFCDMEDSLIRLVLDGWIRGIVAGTDSLLLLGATLMKAWFFKTVVSTFVKPFFGLIYVICVDALCFILEQVEGVVQLAKEGAKAVKNRLLGTTGMGKRMQKLWKMPTTMRKNLQTKKTWFQSFKFVLWGFSFSLSVRLLVHVVSSGTRFALNTNTELSIWQLIAEPVAWWYAGLWMARIQTKLDKTIWKKAPTVATFPLTRWRDRPRKDIMESFQYAQKRWTRRWGYYKQQANDFLSMLFDDVFNMVVMLRLGIITFQLGPLVRNGLSVVGLGSMIQRHSEWFTQATGVEIDKGMYLSDQLAYFARNEAFSLGQLLFREGIEEIQEEYAASPRAMFWASFALWRILLPFIMYKLSHVWANELKRQQKEFKNKWQGSADWKEGEYANQLEKIGTFWTEVDKQHWEAPVVKKAKA